MKLFFIVSLLIISAFTLLTACENEGGTTNTAPDNSGVNDQQKPISPAKPSE